MCVVRGPEEDQVQLWGKLYIDGLSAGVKIKKDLLK